MIKQERGPPPSTPDPTSGVMLMRRFRDRARDDDEDEDVDEDAGAVAEDALPVEEARGSPEAEEGVEDMLCPESPAASFFYSPQTRQKIGTWSGKIQKLKIENES